MTTPPPLLASLVELFRSLDRDDACLLGTPMVPIHRDTLSQAATALEALSAENGALREALEPFALIAEHDVGEGEHDCDKFRPLLHNRAQPITVGHLRHARATLNGAPQP